MPIRKIPILIQRSRRIHEAKLEGTRARDRVNSVRKKKRSRSSSSSSRKRQVKTKKRKTRRLGAGQSYCTMFTSSAAPNDHSRSAHARARDPRPPLLSSSHHPSNSPPRPSSRYRLLASSAPPIPASPPPLVLREQTAATYNLGRLSAARQHVEAVGVVGATWLARAIRHDDRLGEGQRRRSAAE